MVMASTTPQTNVLSAPLALTRSLAITTSIPASPVSRARLAILAHLVHLSASSRAVQASSFQGPTALHARLAHTLIKVIISVRTVSLVAFRKK